MKRKEKIFFSTKWLAYTAMMTALVVVMGYVPALPFFAGRIYWCDFAIYMAAYLLDPLSALVVGGVGTTFFDLFGINGTAYNAIPSLLIHGLQGFTASLLFHLVKRAFAKDGGNFKQGLVAVIASLVPALIVILGYFIKRLTWEHLAVAAALGKMPANVAQEVVGITVAVLICFVLRLKDRLQKAHLLPDWQDVFTKE